MSSTDAPYTYVGSELDLFAAATRWKAYLGRTIAPYLGPEVLEVGAGFGGTTASFCKGGAARWVCLEPDPSLAGRCDAAIRAGTLPACCRAVVGTLADQAEALGRFDTVLYIDVLEHIEDDRGELARAVRSLKPGGRVVVLSPAHQWLFTPFDAALGHYRRYTTGTLRALAPPGASVERLVYLDSVGLLASLGNRLVLRKALPTPGQIALWDKVMVRLSTGIDPLLGHRLGKSVLGVWRAPEAG